MPAVSKAQQALFAIAEHSPEKLRTGKSLKKLPKAKLHEFAATATKSLPRYSMVGEKGRKS